MRKPLYSNTLENLMITAFVCGSTASFLSSSHVGEVARSAIRLGWPVTTVLLSEAVVKLLRKEEYLK